MTSDTSLCGVLPGLTNDLSYSRVHLPCCFDVTSYLNPELLLFDIYSIGFGRVDSGEILQQPYKRPI